MMKDILFNNKVSDCISTFYLFSYTFLDVFPLVLVSFNYQSSMGIDGKKGVGFQKSGLFMLKDLYETDN